MTKGKLLSLLAGPLLFILIALIPFGTMEFGVRTALATVLWMAIWWVGMPVNPAITAFLPVAVNALFSLTDMSDHKQLLRRTGVFAGRRKHDHYCLGKDGR